MQTGSTGLVKNAQTDRPTVAQGSPDKDDEHSVHEIVYEADYFISFINRSQSDNVPPCQKAKNPHFV